MARDLNNIPVTVTGKQRIRNFAPKTRTGCIICKARRVKCDEGQPSCKRCLTRRQACAYIYTEAKMFEPNSTLAKVASPRIIPLTVRYGTSEEASSLAFYIKRTAPMLSMCSCAKGFWTVSVPQASWKYPAVKYMLVALSLLDQYLSSPMSTLIPDAEFSLALKSYNKAIRELTSNKKQSTGSILLTSILAWMFEGISSRPEIANVHITAALKIAAEMRADPHQYLSSEEREIVEALDSTAVGDSYTFLELWAPRGDDPTPQAFEVLGEARASLATVIEHIKSYVPPRTDLALADLRRWRLSFEAYRYKGIEPLAKKRQVFLHHNIVITYIAFQHFSSLTAEKYRQVLNDIEALLVREDVIELREGLVLLLNFLIDDENVEDRPRAQRILKKVVGFQA